VTKQEPRGKPKGRGPGRPRKASFKPVRENAPAYGQPESILSRLDALVQTLGNNKVASILGVSPSQPSRWRSRVERPGPDNETRILQLDFVCARLFGAMMPDVARDWLESHNFAINCRPIDALAYGDHEAVLAAINVYENGGGA
jgi:hypothetical protein